MAITQESPALSAPSLKWSEYNELLTERNDLTQFLPQLREGFRSLDEENRKDPQHPRIYPDVLFQILAYAKSYQGIAWRDTVGTAKTLCEPEGFPVPCFVTIYLRCQDIDLQSLLGPEVGTESDPIDLPEEDAIDDTGFKERGPGEWRSKIHHPKKHRLWLKFHALINMYNRKIRTYGLSVSSIKGKHCAHRLIHRAQRNRHIKKLYGDGEYDYKPLYEEAEQHQFEAIFRPRMDANPKRNDHSARAIYIWKVKQVGWEEYKKVSHYGHRWTIEIAFSAFKRVFGDHVYSRKTNAIKQEIRWKVQIYNWFMSLLNDLL
jgi:hypothetical protein